MIEKLKDVHNKRKSDVLYVDNVITSPDISIVNAAPLRVYSDLVSDHIPLKVDLSFT